MEDRTAEARNVLAQTARDFSDDECSMMAASLAYYTIFSIAPMLVVVITIAGFFWGREAVLGQIAAQMRGVVGDAGIAQVEEMMNAAQKGGSGIGATIVGIVLLVFGATGVMVQLQYALNKVFEVQPDPKQGGVWLFITKRLLSFAMILAIAFVLIVSLVVTSVVSAVGDRLLAGLSDEASQAIAIAADIGISLIVISVLFAGMLKWLPDVELRWRDVFLPAVLTAVLFLVGKFALGIYLGRQDPSAYGPAAALVLILIWVYYSAMIFMFGAEFAQAWSQRHGRRLRPSPGAIPRPEAS